MRATWFLSTSASCSQVSKELIRSIRGRCRWSASAIAATAIFSLSVFVYFSNVFNRSRACVCARRSQAWSVGAHRTRAKSASQRLRMTLLNIQFYKWNILWIISINDSFSTLRLTFVRLCHRQIKVNNFVNICGFFFVSWRHAEVKNRPMNNDKECFRFFELFWRFFFPNSFVWLTHKWSHAPCRSCCRLSFHEYGIWWFVNGCICRRSLQNRFFSSVFFCCCWCCCDIQRQPEVFECEV